MTRTASWLLLLALTVLPASARQNMDDVEIQTIPVNDHVYMLVGQGGNIGVSVGEDGVFLIDDQYAPLTEKIRAAIAALTDQPIRFVVNTHWHGDHTGGNENLGEAGALIVAHENVRARMSVDQFMAAFDRTVPAAPEAALPVITFTDAITFHWNGDVLRAVHVDPAHTDGDAIIFFEDANVVHMGDTYFNGFYPFIDAGSGGRIDGVIAAVTRVLPMIDEETKVIPGHGPLSNKAELRAYRTMLETARDRIKALMNDGQSADDIVAAKPTADLDAAWGGGFMQPDNWVRIVVASLED